MAVTVANLRMQISDVPRTFPAALEPPDTIGLGDGTNTIFFLRFANYVSTSLVIFAMTPPTPPAVPSYAAVSPTAYTVSGNQITFTTAPAAGTVIGSRYQATAFADVDLARYLANAQVLQSDDRMVLKQAQFDLIDVILSDQDKQTVLRLGDYNRNPEGWTKAMLALKESLRKDLTGDPRPGKSVPAFATGNVDYTRYNTGGGEVYR